MTGAATPYPARSSNNSEPPYEPMPTPHAWAGFRSRRISRRYPCRSRWSRLHSHPPCQPKDFARCIGRQTGPLRSGLFTPRTGRDHAMFIETEGTPNPATLKFLPGRDVMGFSTADFASPSLASRSPLASALFALPGISRVFLGSDFVTVTKTEDTDWPALKPQVLGAIME